MAINHWVSLPSLCWQCQTIIGWCKKLCQFLPPISIQEMGLVSHPFPLALTIGLVWPRECIQSDVIPIQTPTSRSGAALTLPSCHMNKPGLAWGMMRHSRSRSVKAQLRPSLLSLPPALSAIHHTYKHEWVQMRLEDCQAECSLNGQFAEFGGTTNAYCFKSY